MNAGTVFVTVLLIGVIVLAVRSLIRQKKSGKSCGCGSCTGCTGCRTTADKNAGKSSALPETRNSSR